MSWSINVIGRASRVTDEIGLQIARQKCVEPEETIKNTIGEALKLSCSSMDPLRVVKVEANGQQYTQNGVNTNSFSAKVETLQNFLE